MNFTFHRIPLGITNSYLLRGEKTILVDAGASGGFSSFTSELKKINIDPKEISLILLTHGHWDHIACLSDIQKITGAKIAIHIQDQFMIETGLPPFPAGVTDYGRLMSWLAKKLLNVNVPKTKADIVIKDEGMSLREYGIAGEVIYTPGHSMGHVSVVMDSGEAFVGDMAMNAWFLRLTPGLPILADDIHLVVKSWKKLLPKNIKQIYPAHGMDFPIEVMQKEIQNFEK